MDNMNVAPIDHGVLSTTGSVAAGAVGSGIKNGAIGWGIGTIGSALIGGLIGAFGFGAILTSWPVLLGVVAGGLIGSTIVGPFIGAIGASVGAVTGSAHALNQVKAEKGAASVLQAQVAAYQAQTQAYAPANDNKYSLPEQGSAMNPASASIQADGAQTFGPINAQGLQRA